MGLQAVIFAAGKGTRAYPLTLTRPKPLLKAGNKTILEHNLEQLSQTESVDEILIVIGYKGSMIKKAIGDEFKGMKITYAEQKDQLGTGDALLAAESHLKEHFIAMNGDDLFYADDIVKILNEKNAVLVKKVDDPSNYGVYVISSGYAKMLVEKPDEFVSDMANMGCYKLEKSILKHKDRVESSIRGEIEITDFISALMKEEKVKCIEADRWQPVPHSWDLLNANKAILSGIKRDIQGDVEQNVTIKGEVIIGKGTVVKAGVYIEGPVVIGENCSIGPNAYIRPSTSIGDNVKIGHEVEIKNCIIMDNSAVPHLSYAGDSILGENVNFAAGCVTANMRHDKGLIRTSMRKEIEGPVKEELIDTGLTKFGTIIGDNVKLGVKTIIYPGRKIWPGKSTLPGEVVKRDVV
ncbi:MAG: sugar phosphate nucleotidyltransferase [Candidatus Woesearchaeota archaeon]